MLLELAIYNQNIGSLRFREVRALYVFWTHFLFMANYRRIWEKYNGPIPKDEQGRSYDIHHIDGDHNNNDISNLIALSRRDHYETHKKQGDWAACLILSETLDLTKEEIHEMAVRTSDELRKKLKGVPKTEEHKRKLSESLTGKSLQENTKQKLSNLFKGRTFTDEWRSKISESRKGHPTSIMKGDTRTEETKETMKASWQKRLEVTCPHCGKTGRGGAMNRHHLDNCKNK